MTAADAAAVANIHALSWRVAYRGILPQRYLDAEVAADRLALWQHRLRDEAPGGRGVVAHNAATMVGFAYACADHSTEWGHLLDNLHVLPECRGRRIGHALLLSLIDAAFPAAHDGAMHLWVYDANAAARRFYARLGATRVHGEVVDTPGGGRRDASVYLWPSTQALRDTLLRTKA
jgi:GNAT superfamily N-acetyltransferase